MRRSARKYARILISSSVGSRRAGAAEDLRAGPRDAAGAVFFVAGFFALDLTGAEEDFFLGAAALFPLLAAGPGATSVTFFSGSVFDFFATMFTFG